MRGQGAGDGLVIGGLVGWVVRSEMLGSAAVRDWLAIRSSSSKRRTTVEVLGVLSDSIKYLLHSVASCVLKNKGSADPLVTKPR